MGIFESISDLTLTVVAVLTGINVFIYTQHRDRMEWIRVWWDGQQQITMMMIAQKDNLPMIDEIVYGKLSPEETKKSEKDFFLFLTLNKLFVLWMQWDRIRSKKIRFGKRDEEQLLSQVRVTLRLICREKDRIRYLLAERGYLPEFAEFINSEIENVEPIKPQQDL